MDGGEGGDQSVLVAGGGAGLAGAAEGHDNSVLRSAGAGAGAGTSASCCQLQAGQLHPRREVLVVDRDRPAGVIVGRQVGEEGVPQRLGHGSGGGCGARRRRCLPGEGKRGADAEGRNLGHRGRALVRLS